MEDRYRRTHAHRFVVIVDRDCRIVAREEHPERIFQRYSSGELPPEVEELARSPANTKQTHMLSDGCLMHIVPIRGTAQRLYALVFEELRVRSET